MLLASLPLPACAAGSAPVWLEGDPVPNKNFKMTSVSRNINDRVSIFSWNAVFLSESSFPTLSSVLTGLGINRIYQELAVEDFSHQDTVDMVRKFRDLGIQTVFLTENRNWQNVGLDEYYRQIDAIYAYNNGIGHDYPIPGVALDVECYTMSEWKADPAAGFAAHLELMKDAYEYAHERGLYVVQVIPTILDTVDRGMFEQFVATCCDELSVMNYTKDVTAASLWNEVHTCRRLGVPLETISETMPLSDYYSVTKEKTYFYEGLDALHEGQHKLRRVYGADVGMAYHPFNCIYHLYTGAYLLNIYPYTSAGDPSCDSNGQTKNVNYIYLTGSDGSTITASLYSPNRGGRYAEVCYLAAGVRSGVPYSVWLDNPDYELADRSRGRLTVQFDENSLLSNIALFIRRK